LKFCHITTFYPPYSFGGDAIWVNRLANALARHGHEVDIIHCIDSYNALKASSTLRAAHNESGVTVHGLKTGWGPLSPLISQQTGRAWPKTQRILHVLNSKTFDVIHYHNISLFGPQVLRLAPDYSGYIKLYTTHEYWLVCPMHVLWKDDQQACDQPSCLRCTLRFRRPPQWWRYTDLLEQCIGCVDAFLSPSRFARDLHYQRGFKRPMWHLPLFVQATDGVASGSPHPRPYFLFAGRLEKLKGLQEVIGVFRDYRDADLVVAGSGEYGRELRQLASGAENIHFLGWVDQHRLSALYDHATALLVPSLCYEIFPLTVLEAFAHRTPVVANGSGALREVVEDSGGGLIYRDLQELREIVARLQTNPALRQRLGERGHRRASESWSEEAHLEAYFGFIRKIAHEKYGAALASVVG
jgi:glycosyltransferase involved in cell wall biosynthesis